MYTATVSQHSGLQGLGLPSSHSRELRLPAATPVISSCNFQFANARGPWVQCRIIVLDTESQADSRIFAGVCAFEDKPLGATREWPVRWRPWRCVSTPVDLDRMAQHPCCNLPCQCSAWICRWAVSLMLVLFVPAAGSAVRFLKDGFSASPA